MKKLSFFLIFTLFFSYFVTTNTYALSCAQPPSFEDAYHDYDAVFIGRVIDTDEKMGYKLVSTEVTKSFKGVENETLDFREDITWGESQIGEEYLFFLNKERLHFVSPLCSPTTNASQIDLDSLTFNDAPSPNIDQLKGEDILEGVPYVEVEKEEPTHSSSSGSFDKEEIEKEKETTSEKSDEEKESVLFGLAIMVMIIMCVIFFIILSDVSSKK